MATINPRKIRGSWSDGYALDLHSTGATFLGYNEFGYPEYDMHRTEIGDLLYRFKYKGDEAALTEIPKTAEKFIRTWGVKCSIIVPVPPTRATRKIQPVFRVADELGTRFRVPTTKTAIKKQRQIPELKNVYDLEERRRLLEDAFAVNRAEVAGQRILVVDDLYRSGATLNAVTEALMNSGASVVYALALTQTRKRL